MVVPGRAFLRRMIDLTKGVNKPHHHIRLSRGAKLDIMLWLRFLDDFNGRSFFLSDLWETSQSLQLYTDAVVSIGFGAVFDRHWLHGIWPNHWKSYNIALLELFPIDIAVHIWGHKWPVEKDGLDTGLDSGLDWEGNFFFGGGGMQGTEEADVTEI